MKTSRDYIRRSDLLKKQEIMWDEAHGFRKCVFVEDIEEAPGFDIPSRWIDNADSYICPNCGFECNNPNKLADGPKHCPQCKMRLES